MIDVDKFMITAKGYHIRHPEQRWGQAVMNTLKIVYPELAERVWLTSLDAFNRDDRIAALICWLEDPSSDPPEDPKAKSIRDYHIWYKTTKEQADGDYLP